MAKTIRNEYFKYLNYDNLMKAHIESSKCKKSKAEIILFEMKKEEYIQGLYEKLSNCTYKHRRI